MAKRGRPIGSTDSYNRQRSHTTVEAKTPKTALELVMPPIRNLIEAAKTQGIAIGARRPFEPAQEEVERAVTILLAAIREAMQQETTRVT
jgi:hypothetical protein